MAKRVGQTALALWFWFAVALLAWGGRSVDQHEAEALWVIEDIRPLNIAPLDALRRLRSNLRDAFDRVQMQPQPPGYFAVLDVGAMLLGEQVFTGRALSALLTLLGTAVIVRLAAWDKKIAPQRAALIAGAVTFYAAANAYTFGLLLFLAAGATWLLLRWQRSPGLLWSAAYCLGVTAVLYTQHIAAPFVGLHFLILVWMLRASTRQMMVWGALIGIAAVLFMPWLILLQSRDIAGLISAEGWRVTAVGLLVIALPVIAVWIKPAGLRGAWIAALLVFIGSSLTLLRRPDFAAAVTAVNAHRDSVEPAITLYTPSSPLGYYDRWPETRLRHGISLDIGWRDFTTDELADMIEAVRQMPTVWLVMPVDHPALLTTEALLETSHDRSFERITGGMAFYSFTKRQDN